jgi:hypothetical protein
LRAFTAKDRKDIVTASENYPYSEFYKVDELITQLGMGEALISTLDEKGRPTELVHTLLRPPYSRMDVLTDFEIGQILKSSKLSKKYNVEIDRESAYEILQEKIARANQKEEEQEEDSGTLRHASDYERPAPRQREEESGFEKIIKSPVTKSIAVEITRGILGVLGLRTTARRSSTRRYRY